MPYNNRDFGDVISSLTVSVYSQNSNKAKPSPPVGEFYLIDDSGDDLLDDSEDFLVTP